MLVADPQVMGCEPQRASGQPPVDSRELAFKGPDTSVESYPSLCGCGRRWGSGGWYEMIGE